jgi:predicted TIM-barrel fold metal-dependent hydrolase
MDTTKGARHYQVISADGHVDGPVDWEKRLPDKYKWVAPKLVTKADGSEWWMIEANGIQAARPLGSGLYCGLRYDEFTKQSARTYHNPDGSLRPGVGGPVARLREQDQDGIDAEILFIHAVVSTFGAVKAKDPDAYRVLVRMYNDFLVEYSSIAPDRLIPMAFHMQTGLDDAIAEMERCKKMGFRGIAVGDWPNGSGAPSKEDDRFWAAALDMDMKLAPHLSFGSNALPMDPIGVSAEQALSGHGFTGGKPANTIAQLILSGVFDRFPKMKIYFAEAQGGWLAPHMDFMDEFYQRWYTWHGIKLSKQPSQYIRDHMRFSFIHDRMAMKLRNFIGTDLLMWGSDFPHSVGTWPDSRTILDELFEDVPVAERKKVLVDNVCEFFGLDPEKPLTPTP